MAEKRIKREGSLPLRVAPVVAEPAAPEPRNLTAEIVEQKRRSREAFERDERREG